MSERELGDVIANITGDVSGQIAVGHGINQSAGSRVDAAPGPPAAPDIKVFISYRREDTEGHAGRVRDWLVRRFGEDGVFQDVDGIAPGEDFVNRLREKLAECDVLLAIIGRQWSDVRDDRGRRRLDDPSDWVRREIRMAIERDLPVIPVLVQGASMPKEWELPEVLAPLARRNAIEVGSHWAAALDLLGDAIERAALAARTGDAGR